jgi:transaldolase
MSKILELQKLGQSIWMDNITRNFITSGRFSKWIEEGVSGVTSNPTIFEKAISSGSDYDEDIAKYFQTASNSEEVFFELAYKDIADTADIFRPVYDKYHGTDGFVSMEVSPRLAHDTEKTIEQGRKIFRILNRPNVMIKVPATKEGITAVKELISNGINVNVTLLFSVERYIEAMKAYLEGLQERAKKNLPIDNIASVASFFVSRVDSNIDKKLDEINSETAKKLKGQGAIANSKLAYGEYQKFFSCEEFQKLALLNAKPQKLLWASTSTKNPDYKKTLYVDELIGPLTVNTMPESTFEEFKKTGTVAETVSKDIAKAEETMLSLKKEGIDLKKVFTELEDEGVKKFADSYNSLLKTIEGKKK